VVPLRRPRQAPARDDQAGLVRGLLPGLAVHFAGCCHPVPGDPIVGVVRTGRGVTIHRSECRTLTRVRTDPEHWLDLGWNSGPAESKAIARVQVMTLNQPGSLGSLSTAIGRQGGNITDLRFGAKSPDLYEIIVDIEVDDLDHLGRVVAGLRALPVVTHVERSQG
jgi:GTP pyrophosphokinase